MSGIIRLLPWAIVALITCTTSITFYLSYIKYEHVTYILPYISDTGTFPPESCIFGQGFNIGSALRLMASAGLNLVANFQETNAFSIHWFGAILTFGVGSLYISFQCYVYIKISPVIGQRKLTMFRILLSLVSAIGFIVCTVTAFRSYGEFKGKDVTKWQKEDGGFQVHQISTITEWITASSIIIYISLFYEEFKRITVKPLNISLEDGIA
ncbi:DNA damage-regulated autophagy modulator protein 2 isoform X2 [Dendroctonus ponderosae]|uniref:DNA damage-regulated autophagy modulator protein 2 isoform X2 n=1 Tax=Dendroctonus ponderosae TaxID=77166 RepID=UPI0020355D41|nr:DNA damage-regulated autophagy modulator protein 2 isoform X2 [Dendroctonus ponderosae]